MEKKTLEQSNKKYIRTYISLLKDNMLTKPFVIGICGGSGSGKTTLLRRISETFQDKDPAIFSMDNYYRPIQLQATDAKGVINFDLPTALDEFRLVADLEKLIEGSPITVKEYFFNSPPDKNVLITIFPSKLVIVEGLFLFHYPEVKDFIDYSIFVEVDDKIQLDRRLYRDQETRGYKRNDIIYQWENHVLPCYQNYILPYKKNADFIFYNDHRSEEQYKTLHQILEKLL